MITLDEINKEEDKYEYKYKLNSDYKYKERRGEVFTSPDTVFQFGSNMDTNTEPRCKYRYKYRGKYRYKYRGKHRITQDKMQDIWWKR